MPTPVCTAMIAELEQEAQTTRRQLERVPDEHLGWRPHPKAMTLGQLALHVASIPGALAGLSALDGFDVAEMDFTPPSPSSAAALLPALEESVAGATAFLADLDDGRAAAPWSLTNGGTAVFTVPRIGLVRSLMLNHWYHHRGELQVYLRILDLPVPAVYGRSADESLLEV